MTIIEYMLVIDRLGIGFGGESIGFFVMCRFDSGSYENTSIIDYSFFVGQR